jgi:hypothetical protein
MKCQTPNCDNNNLEPGDKFCDVCCKPVRAPGNDTAALGKALHEKNQGQGSGSQLVFDPVSGEFVVVSAGDKVSPDATTVDQIATDGFAGVTPT